MSKGTLHLGTNVVLLWWREQYDEEYAEKMKEYKIQIKEWKKRKKLKVSDYILVWYLILRSACIHWPLHLVLCRKNEQLTKEIQNRASWLTMVKVRREFAFEIDNAVVELFHFSSQKLRLNVLFNLTKMKSFNWLLRMLKRRGENQVGFTTAMQPSRNFQQTFRNRK